MIYMHPAPERQEPKKARLWGGRFRTDTDPVMEKFNDSLRFDRCSIVRDEPAQVDAG